MKSPELPVIQLTYDFILWMVGHTSKFSRAHKFSLGDRLEKQGYQVLEDLIRAKFNRDRAGILENVNLELEILRFQIRLARDLKCLTPKSYGYAAEQIEEIGRMVGGWLKQSRSMTPRKRDEP
jgi:hypothetical protein